MPQLKLAQRSSPLALERCGQGLALVRHTQELAKQTHRWELASWQATLFGNDRPAIGKSRGGATAPFQHARLRVHCPCSASPKRS